MSMFKTIGLIIGGVAIGVISSSIISSKGVNMSSMTTSKKDVKSDNVESNTETKNTELNDISRTLIVKSMQIEGILSEVKEIAYSNDIDLIYSKIEELEKVVVDMKKVAEPVEEEKGIKYRHNESEEDMIDRVVEEVIEERDKRVTSISNEIMEKYQDNKEI